VRRQGVSLSRVWVSGAQRTCVWLRLPGIRRTARRIQSIGYGLALSLSLLGLVACGRPGDPDRVRMGLATAPVNLDPRFATDAASARVNRLLYRRLVELGENERPLPGLATWTRPAPDRYLFTLRDDRAARTFAHGRHLTMADVQATLEAILEPDTGSPFRTQLALIERMEVVDSERLAIRLYRPDPLFPAYLALEIMPADLLAMAHPFHRHPVGSGPFRLDGWPEPGRLRLRRIRDGLPLELVEVKDPGVRVMKLLRGEIGLLQNDLAPELFGYLRGRAEVRVTTRPGSNFTYLGLNLQDPRLARPGVRKALAHAIDRGAIIRHVLGGAAQPAQALLPPGHWAGAPDLPPLAHDPALARRLLDAEGFGPGRPLALEFKTSTDPFRLRLATIIQSQLAEVGVRLQVRSLDWGTFYGDIKAGRFQIYSLTWVGIHTPDQFRYLFHSTSLPPAGANRGRYRSAAADALIERAERQPDLTAQAEVYRELQRLLLEELPYIPLWYEDQIVAVRSDIRGYSLAADGGYEGLVGVGRGGR
jgi:peptide/nickel transport system substrate-binding protein